MQMYSWVCCWHPKINLKYFMYSRCFLTCRNPPYYSVVTTIHPLLLPCMNYVHILPAINNLAMILFAENVLLFFSHKSWDQNYFKISVSYKTASEMKTDISDYSPQINTWCKNQEWGSSASLQSDEVRTQQRRESQMTSQEVFRIEWSHQQANAISISFHLLLTPSANVKILFSLQKITRILRLIRTISGE